MEKSFGASFNPYSFSENEFVDTIDRLLADEKLAEKLSKARERIVRDDSKTKACEVIEKLFKK